MQSKGTSGWWLVEFSVADKTIFRDGKPQEDTWRFIRQAHLMTTYNVNQVHNYLGFTYDPQEVLSFIKTGTRPIEQETGRTPSAPEKSYITDPDWKEDPADTISRMATLRSTEKRNKPDTSGDVVNVSGDGPA